MATATPDTFSVGGTANFSSIGDSLTPDTLIELHIADEPNEFNDTLIATGTTDENGDIVFSGVTFSAVTFPAGSYSAFFIDTSDGQIGASAPFTITAAAAASSGTTIQSRFAGILPTHLEHLR